MTIYPKTKYLLLVILCGVLFLAGCANYLKPEIGAIANRKLVSTWSQRGYKVLPGKQRSHLVYSYTGSGPVFNFSGGLSFDSSLTNTFPSIKTFELKMSFLDKDGRVLQTTDITPLYKYLGSIPDELQVQTSTVKPAEAVGIAFNYFGIFRAGNHEDMGGDGWEIFYFPFH